MFIRPFGSVVYLTPAFTIGEDDLAALTGAIVKVIGERASGSAADELLWSDVARQVQRETRSNRF